MLRYFPLDVPAGADWVMPLSGAVKELEPAPVGGLEDRWPDELLVLRCTATGKYGCWCEDENGVLIHGLACFSGLAGASWFLATFDPSDAAGMVTESVTFDEAREIAKARPLPVVSLMLMDADAAPVVHYVR